MHDLILDRSVLEAEHLDFWPTQEKGRRALTPCFDLAFGTGHLKLTYAAMPDRVLVTPERIRIAVPCVVNMERFRKGMSADGALRAAFVRLRWAVIADRGMLTACGEVNAELQGLNAGK